MHTEYLEHANYTVHDLDRAIHFLTTALPSWTVRGGGERMRLGRLSRWVHVGNAHSYISFADGGVGNASAPYPSYEMGLKHLGIVVPSLDAVIARLAAAGYTVDHEGAAHPHRKSVYYAEPGGLEYEFMEYLSTVESERNDYRY